MKKLTLLASCALSLVACATQPVDKMGLKSLPTLATVSERYQAYNVEMVEVTGGRFWAPYDGPADERYRMRPPIDLSDPKLIALAKHLGPSLMRVSGTWANNTYLEAEGENLSSPPAGFVQILTRDQWRGVVNFSKAVDAPIVTSFAVSNGTRDAHGVWQTEQSQRLVDLTLDNDGEIYAAEFFNEVNMPTAAPEMPEDYDADRYASEFRAFKQWARKALPDMKILGPGGVSEGRPKEQVPVATHGARKRLPSEELLKRLPNEVDAFSYHFYAIVSQRCESIGIGVAQKDEALTHTWLDMTLRDYAFYEALRDKYEPGKPIWNTETAQASCGGSPWAATFLDSFRYLNQLGLLAQKGVEVVMHNTLAASDYGLIDGDTLTPRPNYWSAVLWRKVMGNTVLTSPLSPDKDLKVYAHCLRDEPGGVGLLAMNISNGQIELPVGYSSNVWLMTGEPVDTKSVRVNGVEPVINTSGEIVGLNPQANSNGVSIPGQAIAFIAVPDVANSACL